MKSPTQTSDSQEPMSKQELRESLAVILDAQGQVIVSEDKRTYTDRKKTLDKLEALITTLTDSHKREVVEAEKRGQLKTAEAILSMGGDDLMWSEVTPEVLQILPQYTSSTADIPRGKKRFLNFLIAELKAQTNHKGE